MKHDIECIILIMLIYSYFCGVNQVETGFLLLCICNGVDLAASVNAQVQAESLWFGFLKRNGLHQY